LFTRKPAIDAERLKRPHSGKFLLLGMVEEATGAVNTNAAEGEQKTFRLFDV